MADRKVTQLPEAPEVTGRDLLYMVDLSAPEDARSVMLPIDSLMTFLGVTPTPTDDIHFGTSPDNVPQGAELTIEAVDGVGTVPSYVGVRYLLMARIATQPDIISVLFSDDSSNTNQIGVFTKYAQTVIPPGESEPFSVWVSNQILMQSDDLTLTVT